MYPQVFENIQKEVPIESSDLVVPKRKQWTTETKIFLTFFLIAIAGGAIRKWFTSNTLLANAILLLQMIMPFVLYIFRSPGSRNPFGIYKVLPVFFAYLLFHIVNPMQLTVFHGAFGFIIYGSFWIGLFYYLCNREKFDLQSLIWWFIIAATVEVVLGFIQYALPQGHFLNKYAQERHANIAVVGDSVRITGTFSFLSGFTAYLMFHAFLVWALIRLKFPNWITMLLAAFGIIASFMTGSRGGLLIYVAILAPVFLQEFKGPQLVKFAGSLLIPLIIIILFLIASGNKTVIERAEKASNNFWERTNKLAKSGEQMRRLSWGLGYFEMQDKFESPIIGVGAGATYQGSTILFGKSPYVIRFGYVESEFVQVILEGGIVMLILRIILTTLLVLNLSFKGPLRWLIWFMILYAVPVIFNVHNAAFLMMGIMLVDNIIWRQQQGKYFVSGKRIVQS
jgi:hypothetical protein